MYWTGPTPGQEPSLDLEIRLWPPLGPVHVAGGRGILAFSVLPGATAATAEAESAGQQQDQNDDEDDREHGQLLGLGWVGSRIRASMACFSGGQ
jgi:hypothetical protein